MAAVQIAFDFEHGKSAPRFGWFQRAAVPAAAPVATPVPARDSSGGALSKPQGASESESDDTDASTTRDSSASASPAVIDKLVLETELRAALRTPLRLTITDNRRTMISLRKRPSFTELRLHHMFLAADRDTLDALARYVGHGQREDSLMLGRYIEQHREGIKRKTRRLQQLSTSGVHHDLLQVFALVSAEHFGGLDDVRITWGRDPERKGRRSRSRRSIKLGSYCSRDKLIRVHPALDAAFVPRSFVEYIVYHEMLHHVMPPNVRGGRRQLHGRDFKLRERQFPGYAQALVWERENLDRLLRR